MFLWRFFRKFSLPCSLVMGALGYLIFANVPFLVPIGDYCGPRLVSLMPVVLFSLLYVTFCKIEIKEMKPKAWHFILQLIRTSLSLMMVVLIFEFGSDYSTKLILEGAFICFICPTAAAVAVVTEKLGGSIGSLTTYTVIANIFTMVIIPSLFPMVEKGADVSFLMMSAMVFRNVTTVLVVPLLLALLSRRFLPKWVDKVKNVKDLGFYMWCFNLTILMGETVRNMLHAEVSGVTMLLLLFVPLLVCLLQFAIGKAVGRHFGASISAGQALGQKNTVVGIWLTLTFLNPLAAVAPGAYVVWQNLVNGWQLWYKENMASLSGKLAIFLFLILCRVDEVFFPDAAEHLIQIFSGFIFRHRQVVEQVVAAVLCRLSWNLTLEIGDKLKGALHQFHDVLALQVALDKEIVAREASHRSPVDDAVLPLLVVAQIGGSQVFDGMDGTVVQTRLLVRHLHADIECCDDFSAYFVLTAHVDAAEQLIVIDCKTWNLIHLDN